MPAISPVSRGGKALARRPRWRATTSAFSASCAATSARTAAAAISGERSISRSVVASTRHRVVETAGRPVAAPHVEHDGADPARHRDLGRHAVGPEPVDLAVFQRLRRGQAEIDARCRSRPAPGRCGCRRGADRARRRSSRRAQPHLDPGRRADAPALERREVAARDAEVGAHHQEPVHALRQRAEQLDAAPFRERRQRAMRRAADEIDLAVAQRLIGAVDRKDQLGRDVEPLGARKTRARPRRAPGNTSSRSDRVSRASSGHSTAYSRDEEVRRDITRASSSEVIPGRRAPANPE